MSDFLSVLGTHVSTSTLVVAGVALALLPMTLRLIKAQYVHKEGEPPLISGWIPYMGVAIEYGKEPGKYLERMR